MSYPPVTPAAKTKTPSASARKRRRTAEEDTTDPAGGLQTSGAGGDAHRPLVSIHREEIKSTFGEDNTWHGSHYFATITSVEGRKGLQHHAFLWLVFATAFEHNLQFGPNNLYNARNPLLVADFVVEQCGVRPEQIERFPSGGKTHRYLLSFGDGDVAKVSWKLPRGWIKLARGLGCRFTCPAETFRSPFPTTITHVPAGLGTVRIKQALESIYFVSAVTDLQRVIMENNVKTDRVEGMIEIAEMEGVPVSPSMEEFSYKFEVAGFKLELTRRQTCTTCGDEDHRSPDCPVRQKLVSAAVKGWSFVDPDKQADTRPEQRSTTGTATEEPATVVVVAEAEKEQGAKSESNAPKQKGGKKRKGDAQGPPAKKAKK